LRGADSSQWIVNVPQFQEADFAGVYDGIDVHYHGNGSRLEYDFVVHPGASAGTIQMSFPDASQLSIGSDGALVIDQGGAITNQLAPVIYQMDGMTRSAVGGHYVLTGSHNVSFAVEAYDA